MAPQTRRAAPIPPAAPAPGRSATRRPVCSRASAHRAIRSSRCATCAAVAPFCGPKTRAAPDVPSKRVGDVAEDDDAGQVRERVRVQAREPPQRVLRVGGDVGAQGAQHARSRRRCRRCRRVRRAPVPTRSPGRARGVLPARRTTRPEAPRSRPCRPAPDRWCGPPRPPRCRRGARGTPRRAVGRGRRPWTPTPTSMAAPPPGRRSCPRHHRPPPRPAPMRREPRTGHRGGPRRRPPSCPVIP